MQNSWILIPPFGGSSPPAHDRLVLGRRLHLNVGRPLALEDAIDVVGGTSVLVGWIRFVGEQTTSADEVDGRVDGGQPMLGRQRNDQITMMRDR